MNEEEKRKIVDHNLKNGYAALKYRHTHRHGRKASSCISYKQYLGIIEQPCVHCGCPPSIPIKAPDGSVLGLKNSVDRINSKGAYTKNNVQPSCLQCNASKSKMKDEDFWAMAERIANYQAAKQMENTCQS